MITHEDSAFTHRLALNEGKDPCISMAFIPLLHLSGINFLPTICFTQGLEIPFKGAWLPLRSPYGRGFCSNNERVDPLWDDTVPFYFWCKQLRSDNGVKDRKEVYRSSNSLFLAHFFVKTQAIRFEKMRENIIPFNLPCKPLQSQQAQEHEQEPEQRKTVVARAGGRQSDLFHANHVISVFGRKSVFQHAQAKRSGKRQLLIHEITSGYRVEQCIVCPFIYGYIHRPHRDLYFCNFYHVLRDPDQINCIDKARYPPILDSFEALVQVDIRCYVKLNKKNV